MGYLDDAFANLKSELEITPTESATASRRQNEIRDLVAASWTLEDHFLTGSYRRGTKTKKLKDVDMFVVLDDDGPQGGLRSQPPQDVLDSLLDVLQPRYANAVADQMAVTVSFGSDQEVVSFDVVPAFERTGKGGGYEIPDTTTGEWIATNPKTHHEQLTAKNALCDDKFVPLAKMVKGLNRELGEPARSFLLEVMAHQYVRPPFGTYPDEIRWYLANAAEGVLQDWPDPAGLGPGVNTLTTSERAQSATELAGALTIAEGAIALADEGRERAAVEEWRKLFGWRMPRP